MALGRALLTSSEITYLAEKGISNVTRSDIKKLQGFFLSHIRQNQMN
jgi:hypothetical protein